MPLVSRSQSVLSDVKSVSFTNRRGSKNEFNAQILDWNDTRRPRLAEHKFLKRDGSLSEYMGRDAHRVKFNIVYIGENWRKQLLALQHVIDEDPLGNLVHPFFEFGAACEGIDGARVDVQNGIDTVTVPIGFRESSLDGTLEKTVSDTPAALQIRVSAYTAQLSLASAIYVSASFAISKLTKLATSYGLRAAGMSLASGGSDNALGQELLSIVTASVAARDAVRADQAAKDDVSTYATILLIEQLLDACNQMDESLRTQRPQLSAYVVPRQTTLLALAQAYYGPDALDRMSEILNNNIGKIHDPNAIPGGARLFLAPATVKQP